jgi:hypothetical protein
MASTNTTATAAATLAGVSLSTIRTWCRVGAVAAVKTAGKWVIDAASLARRIAIGAQREDARIAAIEAAADLVDTSAFKDAKKARDKAVQILIDRSLVATRHEGQFLVVGSDAEHTYLVETVGERSCLCKGSAHWGRCSHLLAADINKILTLAA